MKPAARWAGQIMPELPEAETIARALQEGLAGRSLGEVDLRRTDIVHGDPRPLGELLPGRRVERVHRRAKQVVIELSGDAQLIFRLGMTGRLLISRVGDAVEPHTHLRVEVRRTKRELRFRDPRRFGGIWCFTPGCEMVGKRILAAGPEPLELTSKQFRLVLRRSRRIKALLMDQQAIAGLGNIYCDESLHAAGIHPISRADALDVDASRLLLRSIKRILKRAIAHQGSTLMDYRTADGSEGSFQKQHRVYQRAGCPCRRCGAMIERTVVAGRSTFYCPSCQVSLNSD